MSEIIADGGELLSKNKVVTLFFGAAVVVCGERLGQESDNGS